MFLLIDGNIIVNLDDVTKVQGVNTTDKKRPHCIVFELRNHKHSVWISYDSHEDRMDMFGQFRHCLEKYDVLKYGYTGTDLYNKHEYPDDEIKNTPTENIPDKD